MMKRIKQFINNYGIIIIILLILEIFYFRNIIFTDAMLGDFGDGKFCMLTTEHWYKVLCGKESIGNLRMFYPVQGSFGYSDLFFGFAPLFCILRLCGIDMYIAFKATCITIHIFGAFSMYYLLNKELKMNKYLSIIGVMIFSYANMNNTAAHPQLYAIYFIPAFIICILQYLKNINETPKKRIKWALLSITSYAVIFYTGSYIGYFVLLAAFVFVILFLLASLIFQREWLKNIFVYVKKHIIEILCYGAYGIALVIPYLFLYIPANSHHGDRPWGEISRYLLSWKEFFYTSDQNLLWDRIFDLNLQIETPALESQNGFPLITFGLFILATVFCIQKYISERKQNTSSKKNNMAYFIMLSCLSTIVCLLFILRLTDDFFGLWYLIYKFFPGAGAMRALARFNNILTVPVAIAVVWLLNELLLHLKKNTLRVVITLFLFCGFILEYTWIGGQYAVWNIHDEQNFLNSVAGPPEDCKTMFILYDQGMVDPGMFTPYQLNSWTIAYKYDLQSINGYTSYYPEGWEPINALHDPAYIDHVKIWIERYDLEGVYAYVVSQNKWVKYS